MKVWEQITNALSGEFSDVSVESVTQLTARLLVAAVMGGLLGWQRELVGKAAGFRTHILVSVGSAAFIAIPLQAGNSPQDVSRVLQGLVAGIGFLGAGCIMKQEQDKQIRGMTTAAGIWFTAGVGVAAGLGREGSAIVLGIFGWLIYSVLHRWEKAISNGKPRDSA